VPETARVFHEAVSIIADLRLAFQLSISAYLDVLSCAALKFGIKR